MPTHIHSLEPLNWYLAYSSTNLSTKELVDCFIVFNIMTKVLLPNLKLVTHTIDRPKTPSHEVKSMYCHIQNGELLDFPPWCQCQHRHTTSLHIHSVMNARLNLCLHVPVFWSQKTLNLSSPLMHCSQLLVPFFKCIADTAAHVMWDLLPRLQQWSYNISSNNNSQNKTRNSSTQDLMGALSRVLHTLLGVQG